MQSHVEEPNARPVSGCPTAGMGAEAIRTQSKLSSQTLWEGHPCDRSGHRQLSHSCFGHPCQS